LVPGLMASGKIDILKIIIGIFKLLKVREQTKKVDAKIIIKL
jgi:hypothetical protein